MKKLSIASMTLLLLFTASSSVNANCIDDSQKGDATAPLTWIAATQREDNTPYSQAERAGYKVYYIDKSDGSSCSRLIPDNDVSSTVFNIHEGREYDFWMTSIDTDGRESNPSEIITYGITTTPPVLNNPAAPTNIVVSRLTPQDLDYSFTFERVTAFDNGDPLPDGAVNKYYLFINNVFTREVGATQNAFSMPLPVGDNVVEFESEIKIGEQVLGSARSIAQTITVEEFKDLPKPPSSIVIPVPEGYDLIINLVPKQ